MWGFSLLISIILGLVSHQLEMIVIIPIILLALAAYYSQVEEVHFLSLALSMAAVLFGLAHYVGGTKYVILATIAGMGYGWVYLTTKRIEGSILTHFGLNLTHFTYPVLVGAG